GRCGLGPNVGSSLASDSAARPNIHARPELQPIKVFVQEYEPPRGFRKHCQPGSATAHSPGGVACGERIVTRVSHGGRSKGKRRACGTCNGCLARTLA